jgi:mono/diheme cytochrome c family protein
MTHIRLDCVRGGGKQYIAIIGGGKDRALSADGGGPVPDLKAFQGTDEQFLKVSLNGRSDRGMLAWKDKLSEDELRAILAFIQSLPK